MKAFHASEHASEYGNNLSMMSASLGEYTEGLGFSCVTQHILTYSPVFWVLGMLRIHSFVQPVPANYSVQKNGLSIAINYWQILWDIQSFSIHGLSLQWQLQTYCHLPAWFKLSGLQEGGWKGGMKMEEARVGIIRMHYTSVKFSINALLKIIFKI